MTAPSAYLPPLALFLAATLLGSAPAGAQDCLGDCDGDRRISIAELVTGVDLAMSNAGTARCPPFDDDANGRISVAELVTAVDRALAGCASRRTLEGDEAVRASTRVVVSTIQGFQVLDFGFLGTAGAAARSSTSRLATHQPAIVASTAGAGTGGCGGFGPRQEQCSDGGARTLTCTCDAEEARLTVSYANCREDAVDGNVRFRRGTVVQSVDRPDFCNDLQPAGAPSTFEFDRFEETVTAPGGAIVTRRRLTLIDTFQPSSAGCVGPEVREGAEEINGTLHFECMPGLAPAPCTEATSNLELTARALRLQRSSAGDPCAMEVRIDGQLSVANTATGDSFTQTFDAFTLTERPGANEAKLFTESGRVNVDCIGDLELETLEGREIVLADAASCPEGGLLEVAFPEPGFDVSSQAAASPPASHDGGGSGIVGGFRQLTFRAADGTVYQVLQNEGGVPEAGAEDVHITTLAGSIDAVGGCADTPGPASRPEAVVAVSGRSIAADAVFRSGIIANTTPPCFNPNANDGEGAICVGPACNPGDCTCSIGDCQTFNAGRGVPIGELTRPGTLVDPITTVGDACAGFRGRAAFRFGTSGPTTVTAPCAETPDDGFTLSGVPGRSVIFAYRAPLTMPFDVGAGGFLIDADGNAGDCAGTNRIIDGVADNRPKIPAPRIGFAASKAVTFDFNGDDATDKAAESCLSSLLPLCAPLGAPTPTPPGPPQPCNPRTFVAQFPDTTGSTAGEPNALGGASCGDGGNRSRESTFLYVAPQGGFYTIETLPADDASFDTLLYVRQVDCAGLELACNDDVDGTLQSRVVLELNQGDRILIVVDGFGGASGPFRLRIRRSDQPPTPTPTSTPGVTPGVPDLTLTRVEAPASAELGSEIDVAATVLNRGLGNAGSFGVVFVFASDPELTEDLVSTGAGCDQPGLSAGDTAPCARRISIPVALKPGPRFFGAVVDPDGRVTESNEGNNRRGADGGAIVLLPAGTATITPTATATPTPSSTAMATPTGTPEATATVTATGTSTRTATRTATSTPTPSSTATATVTPTATATPTPGEGVFVLGGISKVLEEPRALAFGDLDGDGNVDLVAANADANHVSILLGNGDGTFLPAEGVAVGARPVSVAAAHFDDDAILDLAVANANSNDISILLGNGDGTFRPLPALAVGSRPMSVASGDFDQDDIADLAVASFDSDAVTILFGQGDATFVSFVRPTLGGGPLSVAVGRFDGDENFDLAVANFETDDVSIFLSGPDGAFSSPPMRFGTDAGPSSVVPGDFNGDENLDLVVLGTTAASFLPGNGDGTFGARRTRSLSLLPAHLAAGDLDRDSRLDLAVANFYGHVSVLFGLGNGTFQGSFDEYPVGARPVFIAAVDLDHDSDLDLAVANSLSDDVFALRNVPLGTETPTPTATPTFGGGEPGPQPVPAVVDNVSTERGSSLLVFPRVIAPRNFANVPTEDTTILLQNSSNSRVRARCFYINGSALFPDQPPHPVFNPPLWQDTEFTITLFSQQATHWVASQGRFEDPTNPDCRPGRLDCDGAGIDPGSIPPLPYFTGELLCVEIDDSGAPLAGNHLMGRAALVDLSDGDVRGYNAIGFEANPDSFGGEILCLGGETCPGDGLRLLGCPAEWLLTHATDGAPDPKLGPGSVSTTRLTVLPCTQDFENQIPGTADLQFLVTNEFEETFSAATSVLCWGEFTLDEVAGFFTAEGLGSVQAQTRIRPVVQGEGGTSGGGFLAVAEAVLELNGRKTSTMTNLQVRGQRTEGDVVLLPSQ